MSDKIIEGDLLRFSESNKIKTGEVQTKIKETENNLYEKGATYYSCSFYSYNTSDFYSTLVSKTTSAKVLSSPIFKITSH